MPKIMYGCSISLGGSSSPMTIFIFRTLRTTSLQFLHFIMNYKNSFLSKSWKFKLPVIVGAFYIIASLPLILNVSNNLGWIIDLKKDRKIKAVTIRIFLVPIIPVLARIAYLPIDSLVTVRLLGCGCHPGFNANSFNYVSLFKLLPDLFAGIGSDGRE